MSRNVTIKKIRKAMNQTLDEKRFEHTLGVAFTSANLAALNGLNTKDAEIAGLLHDCAKCIDDEKKLAMCLKHNIPINEIEKRTPFLLHAKVGGFLAMNKYHITDTAIVNAIVYHTTGRPNMTLLEKIVYIADYIEPNRKTNPNMATIRKLAYENIDQALLIILEETLQYLTNCKETIDPLTQKTYDFYYKQLNEHIKEIL